MPEETPVYTQVSSSSPSIRKKKGVKMERVPQQPTPHSEEETVLSDSIPILPSDSMTILPTETAQSKEEKLRGDTVAHPQAPWAIIEDQMAYHPDKEPHQWNVSLAYSGLMKGRDNFMASASVGGSMLVDRKNMSASAPHQFSNWADYSNYLKTHSAELDEEKRSLISIATQNMNVNGGAMEARYEHQLPITLQLMLSRQISEKASIETGLSYTQLNSTITTGSSSANIQEHQKLRYVGIPIRFGWTWYDKARLRFYSSAGGMLEIPIHSTVGVRHFYNGTNTFQKEVSPHVPVQWSVSLGLGAQYNVTPHLGIYLEPSLQYFINNGSGLKTYRTEHPFELTLPLGLRFHW